MTTALDWRTDSADWPNRDASRLISAGGLDWHVQVMGEGPCLLLAHGTGSSTHSWRDMLRPLSQHFTVVAPDLPGHAFTSQPPSEGHSLPGMANATGALLKKLALKPARAAGHSAGAAILVRMAVDGLIAPKEIVSFNGAFFPLGGAVAPFLAPVSKFIARSPVMAKFLSAMADEPTVEKLLKDTGSTIDRRGLALYRRLFENEIHVGGTLAMMASWDLDTMERDLARLAAKHYLVKAEGDRSIDPSTSERAARLSRNAALISVPRLGHLAHEEDPVLATAIIADPERYVVKR